LESYFAELHCEVTQAAIQGFWSIDSDDYICLLSLKIVHFFILIRGIPHFHSTYFQQTSFVQNIGLQTSTNQVNLRDDVKKH
jgi:hypothetical protein